MGKSRGLSHGLATCPLVAPGCNPSTKHGGRYVTFACHDGYPVPQRRPLTAIALQFCTHVQVRNLHGHLLGISHLKLELAAEAGGTEEANRVADRNVSLQAVPPAKTNSVKLTLRLACYETYLSRRHLGTRHESMLRLDLRVAAKDPRQHQCQRVVLRYQVLVTGLRRDRASAPYP